MLKKIFSVMCMAAIVVFAAVNSASAADGKVLVLFDVPTGKFPKPENVHDRIEATLNNIVKDSPQYKLVPTSETKNYVQIYREDNGLSQTLGLDGTDARTIEKQFQKEDIAKLCKHFDCDYVFYVRVSHTDERIKTNIFWGGSKTLNLITDFRVWSNAKQDYVYANRITSEGKASGIGFGGRGSKAMDKALNENLQKMESDASKVVVAMQ